MTTLNPGQSATCSLQELNNATPPAVITPPVPFDAPPTWTSDNPSAVSVTPSADGTSAVAAYVAAGTANISAVGVIGGVSFSAPAVQFTAAAAAPVVAAIQIVVGAPTP